MSNWIASATRNKGGLHRSLGVPGNQRIPQAQIQAAAQRGGTVGKQARLALTLEGLNHRRRLKKPAPKRIRRT